MKINQEEIPIDLKDAHVYHEGNFLKIEAEIPKEIASKVIEANHPTTIPPYDETTNSVKEKIETILRAHGFMPVHGILGFSSKHNYGWNNMIIVIINDEMKAQIAWKGVLYPGGLAIAEEFNSKFCETIELVRQINRVGIEDSTLPQ